jgi:hypothetical protein
MSLRDSAVLLLTGQAITVMVLIITNYINRHQSQVLLETELQVRKRIEHLEAQLTNLYGPIYALVSVNAALVQLVYSPTGTLPRKVPENLWSDLRDKIIKPNNQSMVEVLERNFHLMKGIAIPDCVIDFIVHAEVWKRRDQYKLNLDEYVDCFAFPVEFAKYIKATTNQLKKEHQDLVTQESRMRKS